MPSLRRTISSPSMRASPYPTALSAANSAYISGASRFPSRRTASDSYRRRVLADIEWWRVLDSQHVEEQEPGLQQDHVHHPQPGSVEFEPLAGGAGEHSQIIRPSTPASQSVNITATSETLSILSPFAELSISTMSPSTPSRSRHQRDSSSSSTESSPEPSPRLMDHGELARISLQESFSINRPSAPLCTTRSFSFDYITSHQGSMEERFGDIVCL